MKGHLFALAMLAVSTTAAPQPVQAQVAIPCPCDAQPKLEHVHGHEHPPPLGTALSAYGHRIAGEPALQRKLGAFTVLLVVCGGIWITLTMMRTRGRHADRQKPARAINDNRPTFIKQVA